MNKLIILDRDGVINYDSDNYIKSLKEFVFIPDSIKAICILTQIGYKVGVATNQSGIFRNYYSLDTLEKMHQKLNESVSQQGGKIDKICFCPHGPHENCQCRKPKTKMLEILLEHAKSGKNQTLMVGDSLTDLLAADNFGIKAVLVKTGKGEQTLAKLCDNKNLLSQNIEIFDNLYSFALHLKSKKN